MMDKKILFLVPAETASGGIENYFKIMRDEFSFSEIYFIRGAREWPYRSSVVVEIIRIISDFVNFYFLLKKEKIAIMQTSTSLGLRSILRDGVFIQLARNQRIKTVAFFHGWNPLIEKKLFSKKVVFYLFKKVFFKTDKIIVLSNKLKYKLCEWGYNKEIFVETTIVDKKLINNLTYEKIINSRFPNDKKVLGELVVL